MLVWTRLTLLAINLVYKKNLMKLGSVVWIFFLVQEFQFFVHFYRKYYFMLNTRISSGLIIFWKKLDTIIRIDKIMCKKFNKTNIVEWGCTHVSGCTSHRTQNHKLAPYFEEENSALVMSLLAEKKETFIIEKVLAWWSLVCLKGDLSIQLSK